MSRRVVPVSTLVQYLKNSLDNDPVLQGVMIEGEISNIRRPYSGHWYFSIKDEKSSLPCVMFANANRRVGFPVNNGDQMILTGNVTVYAAEGRMQMIVEAMQPSGIGQLYLMLEQRKKKLASEGIFEEGHKKPLLKYPMRIALVTGNNTAAREDVLITLHNRWPCAEIREYPCPVQGNTAAPEIIKALEKADLDQNDVILLVRGGGSLEELWCFNDENLARCIYALHTPIVTGIGHEIDFTLADFAADVRANTPTGAVQAACPDLHEVLNDLDYKRSMMLRNMRNVLNEKAQRLDRYASSAVFTTPERLFGSERMRLSYLSARMNIKMTGIRPEAQQLQRLTARFQNLLHRNTADISVRLRRMENSLNSAVDERIRTEKLVLNQNEELLVRCEKESLRHKKEQLGKHAMMLDAYSPLKVMGRGYSVMLKDGKTVSSVRDIMAADQVEILMSDGRAFAEIEKTEEKTDG